GHAAVEEDRTACRFGHAVGSHLPNQHQFGESPRIAPRQCRTVDRDLLPDDGAAGFDGVGVACARQGRDQAGRDRSRAARDDVKAFDAGHDYSGSTEGEGMDRFWLKSYPPGVPSDIDPAVYPSLVALLEESFAKYRDQRAYVCMDR